MQELIGKLFAALPLYCRQMLAFLSGPRTAILQQDFESDSALQQALTFLAVSYGIAYIAQVPFIPGGQSNEQLFGILAVVSALGFGLSVILVILAWRIVGGKLAGKKVLIVTCYFSGVSTILLLIPCLIAAGTLRVMDPILYQHILSGDIPDLGDLLKSAGYKTALVLSGAAVVAAYAWTFWIWDAYRQLMQLSKLRSGASFFIFVAFSPLLFLAQILMFVPILPLHTAPPLPDDLIGQWQKAWPAGANGVVKGQAVMYSFVHERFGKDIYERDMLEPHSEINAKCPVSVTQKELGTAVLSGSTLVLSRSYQFHTTTDGCSGKTSRSPLAPAVAEYQYQFQLVKQPSGWQLCLSTRFGEEECFTPKKP